MSFSELAKRINAAADGGVGNIQEVERMELLEACENLKRAVESPLDATVRIIFGVSCKYNHWRLMTTTVPYADLLMTR